MCCSTQNAWSATYFYKAGNPNPNLPTSWNTLVGGGGTDATNFNTAGDVFEIPTGRTVTMISGLVFGSPGVAVGFTIQTGGQLDMGGAFVLDVYGQFIPTGTIVGNASASIRLYGNAGGGCITMVAPQVLNQLQLNATFSGGLGLGTPLTILGSLAIGSGSLEVNSCAGGAVLTLGAAATVDGSLRIFNGGTLNTQGFAIVGTGAFELQAGATLQLARAGGINGGAIQVTGTRTYAAGANYILTNNGLGLTNMGIGSITTMNNLTVNGSGVGADSWRLDMASLTVSNVFTMNQRVVYDCGQAQTFVINNGTANRELWIGSNPAAVFTVNGSFIFSASGILDIAPAGCLPNTAPTINGAGSITYNAGAILRVTGNVPTLDMPELPISPTAMGGNLDLAGASAPVTIANNLRLQGNLDLSGIAGRNMVMAMNMALTLEGGGIINAPGAGSKIQLDNVNTLVMRRAGFNSVSFFNSFVYRLVIDNAANVAMTNPLIVGEGGLQFPQAGDLAVGPTTLTLQGNGTNHVSGAGAGRVNATNAASILQLTGNPQLDGAKFIAPIQTLRTGAAPVAAALLNAGTFSVNTLDVANGSLTTSVSLTTNVGGATAVGTTLTVASFGRLIIPNGATITNSGTIDVGSAGTLEIQDDGIVSGTAVSYDGTGARGTLLYTGATGKVVGAEWKGTMDGNVTIDKGAGNFVLLSAAPPRNQNGTLTVNTGLFRVGVAGNLALNAATPVHNVQNGADFRIADGGTISGLNTLTVNNGGTFSVLFNGGTLPIRTGTPNFSPTAVLSYLGVTGLTTGSEFPNAMPGAVTIASGAAIVQQPGTTKTVAGTFTLVGTTIYSINGSTGNGLVLNGPLVNSAGGYFQAFDNNFTINNTVTGNLRFGPTIAEQTLNNFTMAAGSGVVALGAPIVIGATGTLALNGGNITTTAANSLTVTRTAPAAVVRTNGYVDGPLIRAMTAAGVYLFPTGNGGQYLPLSFTNPGAVTVAASAFNANPMGSSGVGLTSPSTTEYWLTNVTAGAYGAGASVTLQRPANFGANTVVGRRDAGTSAGAYNSVGPTGYGGGFNVITSDILTTPAAPMFFTTGQGAQPATGLVFSNITNTSFDAIFTAPTPVPTGYVVVRRLASSPPTSPTNGVLPAVGSALGVGTVLSNNASTGVFANSLLTAGTEYAIDVYSYTGTMATPSYLTGQLLTGNVTTTGGAGCLTTTPPAIVDVSILERNMRFTGVAMTGGGITAGAGTNVIYATSNTMINLSYMVSSTSGGVYCPGCITQIYVGMNATPTVNTFRRCMNFFPQMLATTSASQTFTTPAAEGVYYINVTGTWDFSCQPVNFGTTYVPNNTIGVVIVGVPPCISFSDIIPDPGFTPSTIIPYVAHTSGTVTAAMPNVWRFRLRDGGVAAMPLNDGDNLPTVLQQVTMTITNPAPLDNIALYDASGTVKLHEVPAAASVTFVIPAGLRAANATAADNGTVDFVLKASYKTTVTDNALFSFTITNAVSEPFTAAAPRSTILNPSASVMSGNSGITVVADRPSWSTLLGAVQPTAVGLNPLQITPDVRVIAVDVNGNLDVNYVGAVQIINPPALVGGPLTVNAVAGIATFTGASALRHNTSGTTQLTARIGVNTALSNTFNVDPALANVTPTSFNFGNVAVGQVVEQSFTFTGSTLPSNGLVQMAAAHPHLSISTLGGGAFATIASIALTPTPAAPSSPSGSALTQTFFVRYAPTANTPMTGVVTSGFAGSVAVPVTVQGQGIATSVTATPNTLNFGSVFVGSSVNQFFNTSAINIVGPLTLTASAGVTLSTTGSAPFTSTLTLYPSASTINPQLITARFTPTSFGAAINGTITLTNPYTTATIVAWQGLGANPIPTVLGFASGMESASTATGGIAGALQDAVPITIQAAAFRSDGGLASTTANVELVVNSLPGGVATFVVAGGTGAFPNNSRITLPNVNITWTNAPLAGGTTQAIVTLRDLSNRLQSTQALVTMNKGPIIPLITGISPVIIGSGSTVSISGVNFFGSTTVTFGGVPAANFTINSPTLITARVGTSGASGDVEVRAPGGSARTRTMSNSTDTVRFFGVPTISDFNPKEAKEGDVISVIGTNFDPSATTLFGGIPPQSVTVNSPTQMNASVSANGDNGILTVRAIGGSTNASVPFSFVRPPEVQSLRTLLGTLGTEIVVTGANFKAVREVWLGPVQITLATVSIPSENELRFRVPAEVSGPVTVRNIAGVGTSGQAFTYVFPPQITSVTPDSGSLGNQVIIRGRNFIGVSDVSIAGSSPLGTFVTSTTQIVVVLGRGETGTQPIIVRTIGGVTASTIQFTFINPPNIANIFPRVGGPGTRLTITGANFSVIDRVMVGGLDVKSFEVISTTQIVAIVSDAGGSGFVQVFNRLGGAFSPQQFAFFLPPRVNNFDPLEGSTGSTITINGDNFFPSTTTIVTVGGMPVVEYTIESLNRIIAIVSTGANGKVAVQGDGGFAESTLSFRFVPPRQIPPPRITNFTPDSASVDDPITVEGLNFINVRRVRVNGVTIANFTVTSPTSLTFLLPQVTGGTIEVQTTTGTAFSRRSITVIPPRVALTPLQRDSLAAVQIYLATGGEEWTRRRNWLTAAPLASWQGVTVENGRIAQLSLDSAGLRGTLPLALNSLTAMRSFRARGNSLEGGFPSSLLLLSQLQELMLSNNLFMGAIPAGIGSMAGLTVLRLDGNRFAGQLPPEFCELRKLREINLARNQFSGVIPTCFASAGILEKLDLSFNRFTGGIPTEFAALVLLEELFLQNNALAQPLPRGIWGATSKLLAEKGGGASLTTTGLRSLKRLNISNNQISGEIPTEIVGTTTLQELIMANNQLRGSLPSTLGALTNLRELDVSQNTLTGQIPVSVRDLRQMERLIVSKNTLSGAIPAEVGQMLNVRDLALDSNAFAGAVPDALASLGRLQTLRLQGNRLTSLPNLSGITSLKSLAVEQNRLQFESLETNVRTGITAFSFTYAPQDSVGEARDTSAAVGLPFAISARMRSEQNRYQWMKNGRDMSGNTSLALSFPAFTRLDTGLYNVRVTNTAVRGLTLVTRTVRVRASMAPIPSSAPLLAAPSNQAQNVSLSAVLEWLAVLGATSYDVQIAADATFSAPVLDSTVSAQQIDAQQMRIPTGVLRSFTGYVWRVRARNESGVSAWSAAWNFTTIDAGALVVIPTTDIGRSVVGRTRAGNVEITSVSDVSVRIVGARLEGADIASFRIDTSAASVRDVAIPAFGTYSVRINFSPLSLGVKQVRLILTLSNGGTSTTERSGIVRGTPTFVDANDLNFGDVLAGFSKVTNLVVENLGRDTIRIREAIKITKSLRDTAISTVFQLDPTAPQAPYTILPNTTLSLPIQALSSILGETSATARIVTTQDVLLVDMKASVRNQSPQDVLLQLGLEASTTAAVPGSRIKLFLRLYKTSTTGSIGDINNAGNPLFTFDVRMNRNVLVPAGDESKLVPQSPNVYRVPQTRLEFSDPTKLLSFDCIVVAGDTTRTALEILSPTWASSQIFLLPSFSSSLTALVSRAGGLRLITPTVAPTPTITAVKPNPANAETVIAYTLFQTEPLEIILFDARGVKMRTILSEIEQKAGDYNLTLKTSDLASGQYRLVITTPSGTAQESINIVR